jgi:hypothetical protein
MQENSVKLGMRVKILVCLVPFLVYPHTISFEFVWDDEWQILHNPWIRDWSKVGQLRYSLSGGHGRRRWSGGGSCALQGRKIVAGGNAPGKRPHKLRP